MSAIGVKSRVGSYGGFLRIAGATAIGLFVAKKSV